MHSMKPVNTVDPNSRSITSIRPRLGVVAYWPIQYHSPLYQRLAERGNVDVDVIYLSDRGYRPELDPLFGVKVSWDIDLMSGYRYSFLTTAHRQLSPLRRLWRLARWIPSHDAIVINGYSSPWMLFSMVICRITGIPFLLRASSHPRGNSAGVRSTIRRWIRRAVVSGCSAGLSMGMLNEQFYKQNHARLVIFA